MLRNEQDTKTPSPEVGRNEPAASSNLAELESESCSSNNELLAEVVAACQRGESDARQRLYEVCNQKVSRLVIRMVGSQEAPDLTQQVFLKLFRSIGQFGGHARFETWLYRLVVNECLQFFRSNGRVPRGTSPTELLDRRPAHTTQIQHRELLELALQRIDPDLRCIFLLREIDGLSYDKIAKVLDISAGTVGSRLNRARAQLQERLYELGWEF